MKHLASRRLALRPDTIRILSTQQLSTAAAAFEVASGSQNATGSVTCPPPHGGEGSGCVTG